MKWFLITLAIGLAASDKLDRTYLPPPGAHLAGGILGSHDAPLEPPHHPHSEPRPVIAGEGVQPNFGINGEPLNFGDKIPKVPVTTTSYAFSQTTTYPPGEGFKTTALPINPVTGLPIQLEQGLQNFPYGPSQGQQNVQNLPDYTQAQVPTFGTNIQDSFTTTQAPAYGANIQPGFGLQGSTSAPVNIVNPGYDQFSNQPLNQYQGQNVNTPAGVSQIPGSVYPGQNQGQLQYPGGQSNTQGLLPTGVPDSQRLDQYPGQSVVNPGGVVQSPGGNQGLVQYPGGQAVAGQQGVLPTTGSPINLQPGGNQSGVNYDGSQGLISQGTYSGQPINEQNLGGTQPIQTSYQNQEPINIGGIPIQYPTGKQNYGSPVPTGSENVYQPGSTPSTNPTTYINGVSSTTPDLGAPPSTSSYSSVQPVYRPERPQAAADRNAVILNYENVRTPNGYSYSFDTSNGIHADESGIVDNGTKAQGSYSYIGDDGKVYSVIYTADENGFQPRGDHLPTPPPIPEAIQRVIEQAARDKAAGIVHDGSYDEAKYGDHNYRATANRRRPQNQNTNQFENDQFNGARDDLIKPIAGIKDEKYNEGVAKDQFNNNLPIKDIQKGLNGKLASTRPSIERNGENNNQDVSTGSGRVSGDFHSPRGDFDGNRMPIVEDKINQSNKYGTNIQEPAGRRPGSRLPSHGAIDSDESNLPGSKNRRPSERRPVSGGVKDVTEKYPGSNVDVLTTDKSKTGGDGFYNGEVREIDSGSPNVADGSGENINTNYKSVTGAPKMGNKIETLRQRIKENRGPNPTDNRNTQNNNGRLQGETFTQESTEMPSFSDYFKKGIANQQVTQQGDNGYHYQQPNTKFEQNTFPTRFSPQEVPTTQPEQRRTEYVEGTTRKPFMTPNVYYQNNRNNQSTPNVNNQIGRNRQPTLNRYNENKSTTRRPYTTPFNTDNSYTDYDDGDYATDQDIGNDRIQSTRKPADKRVTSRPYQLTQTTSTPQNVPSGQITRVDQKGTVTPGRSTDNSGTKSSGYTYGPTTQMPSHNSRFGNTEIPRRMKPHERRPTNTVPDFTTAVGRPVTTQSPSGAGQPDYKYQTTGPNFKHPEANVGSGYPTTGSFPGTDLMLLGVSTPRDYTSTYGPTQDYFSTTPVPSISGYTQGSGSQVPYVTSGSYQPPQDETFHTGYHYGPPKKGPVNLDGPGFFTPTGNSGVFPTSPTGTYQTTYQQGPDGFPSTTFVPITPGSQNTFIPSQPGTFAPETSPTGIYPGNYQNGPSTPDYDTTIVSSTPRPVFVYPGSPDAQETTGYEYGPTRPTYSTTESPSSIVTTPGSFIPTGFTGPTRPGFKPTQDSFVGGPVDGFGRPIVSDQGGSHPGFEHPTQGPTGPINNVGPNFVGNDQAVTYPGVYDQTRVIGEDFSGPKQPQRFDPKTGYHYK